MVRSRMVWAVLAGIVGTTCGAVRGDVAIVIPHTYTIGNNYFSCFDYNPLKDPDEFITTGYGSGKDIRWSHVLDDTVEPWSLAGGVLMNSSQIEFFCRDGYASYSLSYNAWGMKFNPLNEKYFIGCISNLRDPFSGGIRVETERDLILFDPDLPNGSPIRPSGVTVSNSGGNYLLVDSQISGSSGFLQTGVCVGDQLTLYPLFYTAEIYSGTYTITEIVNDNTVGLDRVPLWAGSPSQSNDLPYILKMQPWLTLQTFRQNLSYYAEDLTRGPKAHNPGGISPDRLTYYIGDITTGHVLAVDTQQRETFSVFVPQAQIASYVQSLVDSGRHFPIYPDTDALYLDDYVGNWSDESVDTTVDPENTAPTWDGSDASVSVAFDAASAVFRLHATYDVEDGELPRDATHYTNLEFHIHGGTIGGQSMTLNLYDDLGNPGTAVVVPAPPAGSWAFVQIPVSSFGVSTIGDFVLTNTAGAAQLEFFVDQIELVWVDPLPPGVYTYDPDLSGVASAQIACDAQGRVWFSEGESDDLLWTQDGVTLHPFLTSEDIVAEYIASGSLDLTGYYGVSNKVQFLGLTVDPMGTVYWADNQTRSIWKAPANEPADHIIEIATKSEIKAALGLSQDPRGLNNFVIRGHELLTFNFVDSNTVYKVDLNTQDYGDLNAAFAANLADYAMCQRCFGADLSQPPEEGEEDCSRCDVDYDADIDWEDYKSFAEFLLGPG